jgi:flagellar biosynthesis chaperone FliJ
MRKQLLLTGCGIVLVSSAIFLKPNLQGWLLGLGASSLAVGASSLYYVNEITNRDSRLKAAGSHLHRAIADFQELKSLYATAIADRDRAKQHQIGIHEVKNELERENKRLSELCSKCNGEINELKSELDYRDEIVQEWKSQFQARLVKQTDEAVGRVRKTEVVRYRSLAAEGIELLSKLDSHTQKLRAKNQHQDELTNQLVERHNSGLTAIEATLARERDSYLEQIDALNERVAGLQFQLTGGIAEPGFLDEQSLNESARLGNSLVRFLYSKFNVPCQFTGYSSGKLGMRSSVDLTTLIKQENDSIKSFLGIYKIEAVSALFPGSFDVNYKISNDHKGDRDRLIRSRDEFLDYLDSHPVRFRLVGSPGSGKTPLATKIVEHIKSTGFRRGNTPSGAKLPHLMIKGLDPLAGISAKNDGDNPYTVWHDAESGFIAINDEYESRKHTPKKDDGIVFLVDEMDNAIASFPEGGKIIKSLLKDGGHLNIGIICLGQSAMVSSTGKTGLTIDDQKMFLNVFLDSKSMRAFFSNYGEKWYSKTTIAEALKSLEQIEVIAEQENKIIVDSGRKYRFCLVLGERSPLFFELPFFG